MNKDALKEIKKKFFRMIVFGSSQSGKTYFVLNILLPSIINSYDTIYVFTTKGNKKSYENKFDELNLKKNDQNYEIITKNYIEELENLRDQQEDNVIGTNDIGENIYGSNVLIIWDDILDGKVTKQKPFRDMFTNMRHLQFSTIFLTQIVNKVITTDMKANTSYFVIFKIGHYDQRREALKLIKGSIGLPTDSDKMAQAKALKCYHENIQNPEYGYLIISERSELFPYV